MIVLANGKVYMNFHARTQPTTHTHCRLKLMYPHTYRYTLGLIYIHKRLWRSKALHNCRQVHYKHHTTTLCHYNNYGNMYIHHKEFSEVVVTRNKMSFCNAHFSIDIHIYIYIHDRKKTFTLASRQAHVGNMRQQLTALKGYPLGVHHKYSCGRTHNYYIYNK